MTEKQRKVEQAVEELRAQIKGKVWLTLGDWLILWYAQYVEKTAAKSTADLYLRVTRNHIPRELLELPVRSLSGKDIDDYIAVKVREGAAPGTVNQYVTVLGAALTVAVQCGLAEQNPCRLSHIRLLTKQRKEPNAAILTQKERERLERAANPKTPDLGALIILYTGIKIGELLGLRWQDLSLERGELRISHTLQRGYAGQGEKDGGGRRTEVRLLEAAAPRTIIIAPPLLAALQSSRETLYGGDESRSHAFLIHDNADPKAFFELRRYQKYLRDQGRESGIEDLNCSQLRDTYAVTRLQKGGMAEVKNNLGISLASILRKYEPYLEEGKKADENKAAEKSTLARL